MNTFDYITLAAFKNENEKFFLGCRIIKIQQPTKRDLIFTLKNKNLTRKLYININPQYYHVCFASDDTLLKRNVTIPKKPPMFCMLLRKYIDRAKISGINIPYYERILEILIDTYDELNQQIKLCLAIELMGKHSNIILYNYDTKDIIGCAHNIGENKSKYRELAGGLKYVYPPKQNKRNILNYIGTIDYNHLNEEFFGISLAFQQMLKNHQVSLEKIKEYIELKSAIRPVISNSCYSIYFELLGDGIEQQSVNDMIDNYYSAVQEKMILNSMKINLLNNFNRSLKKVNNSIKLIENEQNKDDKSSLYKKYADLILSNIAALNDYSKIIIVNDWETDTNIEIRLNENMNLKENAQYYYKLYNKTKNKREIQLRMKEKLLNDEKELESKINFINNVDSIATLTKLESEYSSENNYILNNEDCQSSISRIKQGGFVIYIGKNNKQNDYIVSKIAEPSDYWFHIKDTTGSHILLKSGNGKTPDDKIIYHCCKLAKQYSDAKLDKKAPVIYTQRKYLKKPPKAKPGYVIYKNETELIVSD